MDDASRSANAGDNRMQQPVQWTESGSFRKAIHLTTDLCESEQKEEKRKEEEKKEDILKSLEIAAKVCCLSLVRRCL